jgi:leucyl aminopeptidase
MQIQFDSQPLEQVEADALVVPVFDKESAGGALPSETARTANDLAGGWIEELLRSGEFTGKAFETAILYRPPGMKARRLLVVGAGKADRFTPSDLRNVAGAAVRFLKPKSASKIAFLLDSGPQLVEQACAVVEGAILGDYEPDRYKTDRKDIKTVERFLIVAPGGEVGEALGRAQTLAEAQNLARDLAFEPANRMNPKALSARAHEVAAECGLACRVLDPDQMRELGMGALLGVAQGSAEPPALIVLQYRPLEDGGSATHLGLIGKGVTFDSGGISIKPSADMDKMKFDMAGGAAVIGAMRAIAQLKPPIPVTALIPAVENMPGSKAQRPGDIVTTMSGKTVEVLNTDAEGRLILADALAYARQLGCTHLVDAATLTGAIVVALGSVYTGVFANNDALLQRTLAAAKQEGEKLWPMPLDDDYKEQLKSVYADMPNVGTRWGGAVTAAMFLKEFAEPTPWVHLDVAGTAWLEETKPYLAKGPTGVAVRTLASLAIHWTD